MNKTISNFLRSRIDAGDFPSAVYLVAEKGEIRFQDALGHAVVEPERIEAKLDTIYDVASLTKPLVAGLLVAMRIQSGELELGSRIGEHSHEFEESPLARLTIKDLATHVSGLPAWRPLFLLAKSATTREIGSVLGREKLTGEGTKVEYSDLNFIAMTSALLPGVDVEFKSRVAAPLGLERTVFNPLSHGFDRSDIAASEMGNEYEKQTCIEQGYFTGQVETRTFFREDLLWGEVHDGNAYFLGGVAGHAGLFSTAHEVFQIAQQFLPNYSRLLSPATCELFGTNLTPGLNENRSFAFQLASTEGSTAGSAMSPESFGHTGFTGTSLWIDPVRERILVLLTNRTHDHAIPFVNINSVRRGFHDMAVELLDGKK